MVMAVKYFEYHLWVETYSTRIKLALFSLAKPVLAPNCGSHFSFMDLVMHVGTPSNSDITLSIILAVGMVHSSSKC